MALEMDRTLYYKCKKETIGHNHVKILCKWTGALEDYIAHFKQQHPQSYFAIPKHSVTFEWKIPYVGDQEDKTILCCDSKHILYQIYYRADNKNVRHKFLLLDEGDLHSGFQVEVYDEIGKNGYICEIGDCWALKGIEYLVTERTLRWTLSIKPYYLD